MSQPTASRVELLECKPDHAQMLCQYYVDNKAHLAAWEPKREPAFYTVSFWQERLSSYASGSFDLTSQTGSALSFVALHKEHRQMVGTVNLSNITLGVSCSCFMGYSVDRNHLNQGYASEIAAAATDFAFTTLGLHRVCANYMPENYASGRVLEKIGFQKEGFAKEYLKINGVWRDHVLTARVNPHGSLQGSM